MASFYLVPDLLQTFFVPGGNTPASGGKVFTYEAGSSTKQTCYMDSLGNAAHTNPIVLDSGGRVPNGKGVWVPAGKTIDVVFTQSIDSDPPSSPYYTLEDLPGINDITGGVSEWVTGPTPSFVNATQFLVNGDQTATFKNGRRIRTQNTGGAIYSRVASSIFTSGSTTINVVSDSGSLDLGLNATAYGLLDPQNVSINEYHVNKDGGSVSTQGNGTTNIWGVSGNVVHLTGTNSVFSFSSASYAGVRRTIIADSAFSLIHNATSLSCPGNTDLALAAGDRIEVLASTTANAVVIGYQPVSLYRFNNGSFGINKVPDQSYALDVTPTISSDVAIRALAAVGQTANLQEWASSSGAILSSITSSGAYSGGFASAAIATQSQMESASTTAQMVTPGRMHFHPGMPKAWVYVDTNGGIQTSHGVLSVTDVGTGLSTVNFSTPFASAVYAAFVNVRADSAAIAHQHNAGTFTASSCAFRCFHTTSNAGVDPNFWFMSFLGDFL